MQDSSVFLIDQNRLPFEFVIEELKSCLESCEAIRQMKVRGAGAIGAAAGFAMAQAFLEAGEWNAIAFLDRSRKMIEGTRPTAKDLFFAVNRVWIAASGLLPDIVAARHAAVREAQKVALENTEAAKAIGRHGNALIGNGARILTHCNAGWLAFVDFGSALSPVYEAHQSGKNIFVYVDETRPRAQGARLTAWELQQAGIPYTIVPDNAGAYLMSKGMVDLVIVGADRIAANGDTANKIGTFEKAILAKEFGIPLYVAAPHSTFDKDCPDGSHIIIEERNEDEVLFQSGPDDEGRIHRIRVAAPGASALNPAFDVTPARFITAYITESGIVKI
jgi:S-methyl-5-thioribose-1-phosphate isomerase